jgi:hypothetical protein
MDTIDFAISKLEAAKDQPAQRKALNLILEMGESFEAESNEARLVALEKEVGLLSPPEHPFKSRREFIEYRLRALEQTIIKEGETKRTCGNQNSQPKTCSDGV